MEDAAVTTPARSYPARNYIIRHWRGELSLARSFWVNEVLLSLVFLLAMAPLYFLLLRHPPSPRGLLIMAVLFLSFTLAVATWQCVGVWRSASRHKQRGGKHVWVHLVRVLVIVGFIDVGYSMLELAPALKSAMLLAINPTTLAPFQITVLSETELEFNGGFAPGSLAALEQALTDNPTVDTLHLNSGGGLFGEARAIGMLIEEKGLITYTNADCLSACTLAFMAGKERLLGESGRLGFHAAALFGSTHKSSDLLNQYRDALQRHGASKAFVDKVLDTGSDDMWYPDTPELKRNHVITDTVEAQYFTDARLARLKDPGRLDTYLRSHMHLNMLADLAPAQYEREKAQARQALNDPLTFAQFRTRVQTRDVELIQDALRKAPSPSVLEFWRAESALVQAFHDSSAQDCAAYLAAIYPKGYQLKQPLPPAVITRVKDARRQVIQTASQEFQERAPSSQGKADLEAVLSGAPPDTYAIYASPSKHNADPEKLCKTYQDLYQRLLALPDETRAAGALRELPGYKP
ncbi:hypothetical protein ICY20_27440 [Pseudomonas sp. P115]|uniref:hypothetical protein n=1 Tax=Pseudomonas pisciculturae TaxID=2730413 RepID=UPI0018923E5E|nr:hypothetical protein [Pseudomonas pisciculturae]MBF6031496.1 hypothetical protein [Pseudomonas pisciculturae]